MAFTVVNTDRNDRILYCPSWQLQSLRSRQAPAKLVCIWLWANPSDILTVELSWSQLGLSNVTLGKRLPSNIYRVCQTLGFRRVSGIRHSNLESYSTRICSFCWSRCFHLADKTTHCYVLKLPVSIWMLSIWYSADTALRFILPKDGWAPLSMVRFEGLYGNRRYFGEINHIGWL